MSVEVRAAAPVTTAAVSPLTYPVMVSVKVGSGAAKARVASTALTVRVAGVTVIWAVAVCPGVVGGVSGGEGGG